MIRSVWEIEEEKNGGRRDPDARPRRSIERSGDSVVSYIGTIQFKLKLKRELISLELSKFLLQTPELVLDPGNDLVGLEKLSFEEGDVLLHGISLEGLGIQGVASLITLSLELSKLKLQRGKAAARESERAGEGKREGSNGKGGSGGST
jgi:hypothetical protein